jgi:hypothetical protein
VGHSLLAGGLTPRVSAGSVNFSLNYSILVVYAAHTKYKFRVTRRRTANCPARLVVASRAEFLDEFASAS